MYNRQDQRLLGGSLHLLSDKSEVPQGHSLELTNCRADKLGKVVSRRGAAAVNSGTPMAQTDLHTLAQRPEGVGLYLGSGAQFARDNGGTLLFSGFDGEPLGTAAQNGFLWVMNRSAQKKDNGSAFRDWLPAPPATAPVAAPGAQSSKTFTNFHSTETAEWVVTDDEDIEVHPATPPAAKYPNEATDPAVFFDSATKVNAATDSMRIHAHYSGVWAATRTLSTPTDFSIDSLQRDSDRFRFHLLSTDPDAIATLAVAVDVNAGDFTTDYYSADIPVANINLSRLAWNAVNLVRRAGSSRQLLDDDAEYRAIQQRIAEIRERIDAGLDESGSLADTYELERLEDELQAVRARVLGEAAGFRRVGSTSGKDWTTVKAIRFTFKVTRPTYVWLDEATIFGGVNGSFEGDMLYRTTFVTVDGHESNPSPVSTAISVSREGVNLSSIPTSPDSQVNARNIYRGGGTLGAYYLVHTLSDNTTTTWTDNISDDQATLDGVILQTDRDPPPAARGVAGPFFNRLIIFNTDANPNRFWWTKVNEPQYVPARNFNDVGDRNSGIVAVTHHARVMVFYKTGSIHILAGDPDINGTLEESDAVVGALGPNAVAKGGGVDYLAGPDGVYEFNMHSARKLSTLIDPIFQGQAVTIGPGISIPPISSDVTARARTVVEYAKGFVRVSYAEDGQSYPNVELLYHVGTGQWSQNRWNLTNGGWRSLLYDASRNKVYGGQRNGVFYEIDDTLADAGADMLVEWQSGYHDQGTPDREKIYEDLVVEYDTGGDSHTLKAAFDDGDSIVDVGTLTGAGRTIFPMDAANPAEGRKGRNISIRTEGNSDGGFELRDITLHYRVLPRRSRSYDSGEFDLGTRNLKRVTAFDVVVETEDANALNYELLTDFPGRVVTSRETGSKSVSGAGQHRLYIELSTPREGSVLRLLLHRTTEFYVRSIRAAVLPYGVHVDGDVGEDWETEELDLAA